MMVKQAKEIEYDEEETANHPYHLRSKQYTKLCYWCKMFGCIQDDE